MYVLIQYYSTGRLLDGLVVGWLGWEAVMGDAGTCSAPSSAGAKAEPERNTKINVVTATYAVKTSFFRLAITPNVR